MLKRIALVTLLALIGLVAWSEGTAEPVGKVILALDAVDTKATGMGGGKLDPDLLYYGGWIAELFRRQTGRELEVREIVASGGTTQTIDMVLASGERLDVIAGYAGRLTKWATPAWALPLSDYISKSDLAKWAPGALDAYYRGGKLYALPCTGWAQTILLNTDIVKKIGMVDKLPNPSEPWPISDFEEMCKRVKRDGLGYGLAMWATQTSGDYWVQLWLTGFGAELWRDGKVVLDSPEGRAAVAWLVKMQEYAPIGPAGLDYNVMLSTFKDGKLLAAGGSASGWTQDFAWQLALPPSVPGKRGKAIVGIDPIAVVFNTTKEPRIAVELAKVITGREAQTMKISNATVYPTLLDTDMPVAWGSVEGKDFIGIKQGAIDQWFLLAGIVKQGVWDAGHSQVGYMKCREEWLIMLQSLFLERATVDRAVAEFQRNVNAFIDAQ